MLGLLVCFVQLMPCIPVCEACFSLLKDWGSSCQSEGSGPRGVEVGVGRRGRSQHPPQTARLQRARLLHPGDKGKADGPCIGSAGTLLSPFLRSCKDLIPVLKLPHPSSLVVRAPRMGCVWRGSSVPYWLPAGRERSCARAESTPGDRGVLWQAERPPVTSDTLGGLRSVLAPWEEQHSVFFLQG